MALVSCGLIPMPALVGSAGVGANSLIDAADEYIWSVLSIGKSGGGDITHIHFRTTTVTTGTTVIVSVVTVDGSGQPTTTLWGTTTSNSYLILLTDDNINHRVPLDAAATVALGDIIGITVKNDAAGVGVLNIARAMSMYAGPGRAMPYSGGPLLSNKVDAIGSHFALEYSDGTIAMPAGMLTGPMAPTLVTITTASNPDEVGIHFTPVIDMRVSGWWFLAGLTAAGSYRVSLYAASSNTPLATSTGDTDHVSNSVARTLTGFWDDVADGITLAAGTAYRLTLVPLSATNHNVYRLTAYNNACYDSLGLPGAQATFRNRSGTSDPDAAAWTETSTDRYVMGLIVDQLDDGAGGGASNPKRIIGG